MWKYYNAFRRFCAFIIGMVLFLSGILKLLDPVGAGLVVAEYYRFLHLNFLLATSECIGVILAFIETILGVALMTGLWRKIVSIVTFSFLGIFTLLTLILLIFNPVMDCGCFGEAIHLTHFQSFIKNIVLVGLAIVAFIPGRLGKPRRRKYVAFGIVTAFVAVFGVFSLLYIPLVDFTEFKPGAQLEASIVVSPDVYNAVFIYEKDGTEETFTLDNLPDSTWAFVRTETSIVSQSDENIIALSFSDTNGEYVDALATQGDVLVFSVYEPKKLSRKGWIQLSEAVRSARESGFTPLVLASADQEAVTESIAAKFGANSDRVEKILNEIYGNIYTADYKTLMTMNRSNGGATYFKNGVLVMKWARRSLPQVKQLDKLLSKDMVDTVVDAATRRNLIYEGLIVLTFGILFFI